MEVKWNEGRMDDGTMEQWNDGMMENGRQNGTITALS